MSKNFRNASEEQRFFDKPVALFQAGPKSMIQVIRKNIPHRTLNNQPVQVSLWFDGEFYHPLVETVSGGNVTSGRLLRHNVRLISAMKYAEEWVQENCFDNRN